MTPNKHFLTNGLLLVLFAGAVSAQTLSVVGIVAPGIPTQFDIANTTNSTIAFVSSSLVATLDADGELVMPDVQWTGDVAFTLAPGMTISDFITFPTSGVGASGSFLAYTHVGAGAVTRVDLGLPSPTFPEVHAFPANIQRGFRSHQVPYGNLPTFKLANLGTSTHVMSATDVVNVYLPGAATPLASTSLSGLTIAANGVVDVVVPLSGVPYQPLTVEFAYLEPVRGPRVLRFGVTPDGAVDLHFPEARTLAQGATVSGHALIDLQGMGSTPLYAFLIGTQPGSTPLPGGAVLPLDINDPLVMLSVTNGIFGLMGNNLGTAAMTFPACFCPPGGYSRVDGITLTHPGLVPLGGVTVRGAMVIYDAGGAGFKTSQPVEFTLQ